MVDRLSRYDSSYRRLIGCCLLLLIAAGLAFTQIGNDSVGTSEPDDAAPDLVAANRPYWERFHNERGERVGTELLSPTDSRIPQLVESEPDLEFLYLNKNVANDAIPDPGNLEYLLLLPRLRSLWLCDRSMTDSRAVIISRMPQLEELYFATSGLTEDGIHALSRLNSIKPLIMTSPVGPYRFEEDARIAKLLRQYPQLERVSLSGSNVGPLTMRQVGRLAGLQSLILNSTTNFSPEDFGELRHLPDLREFQSWQILPTAILDRWLSYLGGVRSLQKIILRGDHSDVGTRHLANLSQMQFVDFSSRLLTDDSLVSLRKMTKLQHLDFRSSQVTGSGLRYLSDLKHLKTVSFATASLEPRFVRHFLQLTGLQSLNVGGMLEFEDRWKSLTVLKNHLSLKQLAICLTDEDRAYLQSTLPSCHVESNCID